MRAHLFSLFSADTGAIDLSDYVPDDPEYVGLYVEADVGVEGEEGADSFGFAVRTPRWLADEAAQSATGYLAARHYLILPRWDFQLLWKAITELCAQAEGPDWESVAARLARYGHWEYEDFQECVPLPAVQP